VDGTDAAVGQSACAVGDLIVDIAGGKLWLGASAEFGFVQTSVDASLAVGEFLSYLGVHSKSLLAAG
jgi:hypothetical protein